MFGLGKKARKAATEIKKMDKRDDAEAIVWIGYDIAFADGTCEPQEIEVLDKTISALPALSAFMGEISTMGANVRQSYEASARRAHNECLRQLGDIAGTAFAEDVLCVAIDIAEKCGGIGDEERDRLKEHAAALQLNLDKFL